ncbi:MAG: M50 family peptidase, partial [candidate division NC10 bacterium]
MVLSGLCYLLLALAGVLGLGFGALLSLGVSGSGELLLLRLAGGVGAGALLLGAASRGAGPGL